MTSKKDLINIPVNAIPAPHLGIMAVTYYAADAIEAMEGDPAMARVLNPMAVVAIGTVAIHTVPGGKLWAPQMTDLTEDGMMLRAIMQDALGAAVETLGYVYIPNPHRPGCLDAWMQDGNPPKPVIAQNKKPTIN